MWCGDKKGYSMNNLKRDGVILNVPIFLVDWTEKLFRYIE